MSDNVDDWPPINEPRHVSPPPLKPAAIVSEAPQSRSDPSLGETLQHWFRSGENEPVDHRPEWPKTIQFLDIAAQSLMVLVGVLIGVVLLLGVGALLGDPPTVAYLVVGLFWLVLTWLALAVVRAFARIAGELTLIRRKLDGER